jgi:hypothetical protein
MAKEFIRRRRRVLAIDAQYKVLLQWMEGLSGLPLPMPPFEERHCASVEAWVEV